MKCACSNVFKKIIISRVAREEKCEKYFGPENFTSSKAFSLSTKSRTSWILWRGKRKILFSSRGNKFQFITFKWELSLYIKVGVGGKLVIHYFGDTHWVSIFIGIWKLLNVSSASCPRSRLKCLPVSKPNSSCSRKWFFSKIYWKVFWHFDENFSAPEERLRAGENFFSSSKSLFFLLSFFFRWR